MKTKKAFPLLLICALVFGFSMIPNAFAVTNMIYSYTTASYSYSIATTDNSGVYDEFTGDSGYIISSSVLLKAVAGNASWNMVAVLYNSGVSAAYSTSNVVPVFVNATSTTWINFTFPGTFQMTNGTTYVMAFIQVGATSQGQGGYLCNNAGGNAKYRSGAGAWSASTYILDMEVFSSSTPSPTPTPIPTPPTTIYHYSILPAPNYTIWNYITSAQMIQATHYVYTGTIVSNSTPYGSGTYAVYKTPFYYNGSNVLNNATDALGLTGALIENLSQNRTGTFSLNGEGQFSFSIDPEYILGSWKTYQGYKINGTITSTGETFTSYIVVEATEPSIFYVGMMTGGHYGSTWWGIATAPTEVPMNQKSNYAYRGETYIANVRTGNGNYTTYSTGLSSSSTIWTTGTYSQVATGNVTNGVFTFNFASRESISTIYEGYRVFVLLDNGLNYTATYYFSWKQDIFATPGTSGLIPADSSGLSGSMLTIISFLILFLLIGAPALLLGTKAGMPGLIVGAVLGLGIGVIAGLVPFWFIFLVGLGTAGALFMWKRNDGQG